MTRIPVNPEPLTRARERAGLESLALAGRFPKLSEWEAIASQIIAAAIKAGLIKPDESVGKSRKYARYLPFWA